MRDSKEKKNSFFFVIEVLRLRYARKHLTKKQDFTVPLIVTDTGCALKNLDTKSRAACLLTKRKKIGFGLPPLLSVVILTLL